jgi:hypothetical protein
MRTIEGLLKVSMVEQWPVEPGSPLAHDDAMTE